MKKQLFFQCFSDGLISNYKPVRRIHQTLDRSQEDEPHALQDWITPLNIETISDS